MMGHRGFSLMELLMVVVIIAILAAMALPQYGRTVERGYCRSARGVLETIYSGEQVRWTTKSAYVDPAACPVLPGDLGPWRCIYMDDPNVNAQMPVTFTVNGVAANTFTANATHNAGGPCGGQAMSLDQNRTLGGGWTGNPACC